jgi:UDPglucose 6-dehydrogenase
MAQLGHTVVGVDVDTLRIAELREGHPPFHEPHFGELLSQVLATGRLRFTTDMDAAADCSVHFICVGTPQVQDGLQADLTAVNAVVHSLKELLSRHQVRQAVVVGKSTVPVGTAERLAKVFEDAPTQVTLVWNPEFLREGFAVKDTLEPSRIVYGLPPGDAGRLGSFVLDEVYKAILERGTPRIETSWATAELTKAAANSFLATKISFINAMSEMCDASGGDVIDLAQAIGLDPRIGSQFLRAGVGFGGGCLPKDIRAFGARASELGVPRVTDLLRQVDAINLGARERMFQLVAESVGTDDHVTGLRIGVLGAAFKPNSDDMRDSPALDVSRKLAAAGAEVVVYDPAAGPLVSGIAPELRVARSLAEAASGADALVVLTEWNEFIDLDPATVDNLVARRIIIDGRGALSSKRWRSAGWTFRGLGRGA